MIKEINTAWNWKGIIATEVIRLNEFGNVIFKTDNNEYWRICPEEASCDRIAETDFEFQSLLSDPEFIEDWEMTALVNMAKSKFGELQNEEKFCFKIAAAMGGEYALSNIGKINFSELIAFSGDLGYKLNGLKDGQRVKLTVVR